ncbi:hypothetical protein AKJ16_DCAP27026 [Drosera capensis]
MDGVSFQDAGHIKPQAGGRSLPLSFQDAKESVRMIALVAAVNSPLSILGCSDRLKDHQLDGF